jgi:hypothetical protein
MIMRSRRESSKVVVSSERLNKDHVGTSGLHDITMTDKSPFMWKDGIKSLVIRHLEFKLESVCGIACKISKSWERKKHRSGPSGPD